VKPWRLFLLILVSLEALYYGTWTIMLWGAWFHLLPGDFLGIPMRELAETAPIPLTLLQILTMVCKVLACLAVYRRWKSALWWICGGIALHLALWLSLAINPIYDGRLGYLAIVVEFSVLALVVGAKRRPRPVG